MNTNPAFTIKTNKMSEADKIEGSSSTSHGLTHFLFSSHGLTHFLFSDLKPWSPNHLLGLYSRDFPMGYSGTTAKAAADEDLIRSKSVDRRPG